MGVPISPSSSSWPEKDNNLSANRKRAIQELVQGRESATKLQLLLQGQDQGGGGSVSAPYPEELVLNILASFTKTLSVLTSATSDQSSIEVSDQNPAVVSPVGSACCDDRRSEDSGDSRKRAAFKDRRGCYKRRKNVQSWTTITPATEDGQAWRKYGQKEILNAKHPRSYYRCTRKYDQGCRATKQVQRMEDNSEMYKTTYIGVHTCRDMLRPPQILTGSDPWEPFSHNNNDQSSNILPTEQDRVYYRPPISSTVCGSVKEESKESDNNSVSVSALDSANNDDTSAIDSILWPDFMSFDSSGHALMSSSKLGPEVVSMVYSCTDTGSESLDMDFVVNSVNFDDSDFNFDENEFV